MKDIQDLKETAPGIYEIHEASNEADTYVLDGGAVVNFNGKAPSGETVKISPLQIGKRKTTVASWGVNNNAPTEREALVMDNHIMPELLQAKRNFLIGQEAILYKQKIVEGKIVKEYIPMTEAVRDFLEDNDFGSSIRRQAKDIIMNSQNTMEYIRNGNGGIASMKYISAKTIRAEALRNGRISNWFISDDWTNTRKEVKTVVNYRKGVIQPKFIKRWCDEMFGGPYYYMSAFWGSRAWIQLANVIPIFHTSNLKNGYSIRYHIEFPRGYFLKLKPGYSFDSLTEDEQTEALSDANKRKLAFLTKFNDTLKGIHGAGRAIHSTYAIDRLKGVALPGIKITPISTDLKDEALLKLFDKSNDASVSGAGILPSLSGIANAGALSSGSDIRNAHAFYIATKTPEQRRILYAPWIFGLRENKLIDKDTRMGSLDEIIVTTDKDKSGTSQRD